MLIRQVLGAVAEIDKAMTVAKLRGARERKRQFLPWLSRRGGKTYRPLNLAWSVVIVRPVEKGVVVPARAAYSHSASVTRPARRQAPLHHYLRGWRGCRSASSGELEGSWAYVRPHQAQLRGDGSALP